MHVCVCVCVYLCCLGEKTKILIAVEQQEEAAPSPIMLQNHALQEVECFSYLGSQMEATEKVQKEVTSRIEKARTVYQIWRRKVFRSCNLSKETKMRVFRTMVMSVLLYGAETWPVTKKEIRKLTTFQMRCLRDILGVTLWHSHHISDILRETGRPIQAKETAMVWSHATNARPPCAGADAAVPPKRKKKVSWWNSTAMG